MTPRRRFLTSALAVPAVLYAQRSRRYRTALIGTGWWGMNILNVALSSGECEAVGLCDVDENQLSKAAAEVAKSSSDQPRRYKDFREMLAKERPDIAIVATPDHWHALAMIEAVKQGAHVYLEKPIGHTVLEGRAMVNAARAADRAVQVGFHRRVSPHNKTGLDFLRTGRVGRIGMVRAFVHYPGGPGERTPDSDPPPGLDWDMWVGPAPMRPFNKTIHPRGFRQYLDFANGQLGDWGVHWMDQILWWTEEKYPKQVYSTGGRRIKRDSTDAPDTQIATYHFESFDVVWEHRQYAANEAERTNIGCYFYGTEGTFHLGWQDGWTFYPSNKKAPIERQTPTLGKPDDQNIRELWGDFLASIKTRHRPVADIEIGHRSTNMALLGMLSLKLGRAVNWDGERDQVIGDAEANRLLRRDYRGSWKYPV